MSDAMANGEDTTGPVHLPSPGSVPEHVLGLEMVAKDHERRLRALESWGRWIVLTVAGAAASIILAIVTAAYTIGARMEALSQVGQRVDSLTARVERVEDHVWRNP